MEIQPGEFWEMTLPEFLIEAEVRQNSQEQEGQYAGGMTRGDLEEISDWMKHGTAAA